MLLLRPIIAAIENRFGNPRDRGTPFAAVTLVWMATMCWTLPPNPAMAADIAPQRSELLSRQLVVLFDREDAASPPPRTVVDVANAFVVDATLHAALGHPVSGLWPMQGLTSPVLQRELAKNPRSPRARLEWYVLLTFPDVATANLAKLRLGNDPRVLSVGSNLQLPYATTTPNDTYFSINPSLPYPGDYQWGMQLLNLPRAWDAIKGTAYVGVVDHGIYCSSTSGGVCTAHADLQDNFKPQFSRNMNGGVVDELQGEINSFAGHGTHVAGIIGATPQNSLGVAGACFACSLAIVKIARTGFTVQYDAITYAVDSGMQVVNFSVADDIGTIYPYDATSSCYSSTNAGNGYSSLCDAIAYAKSNDVVVVAASGNDYNYKGRLGFPAIDQNTIAAGGVRYGEAALLVVHIAAHNVAPTGATSRTS
jgi:hypothetical protein